MQISNHHRALLALLPALFLPATLQADVATFTTGKTKLSGELQAINEDGVIEWISPYSPKALKLRSDKLEKVVFSSGQPPKNIAPVQITLRNGDILPVSRVSALENGELTTDTLIAGTLTIPRAAITSAQFGVTKQNIVYEGFESIRPWTRGVGEPDNLKLRGKSMISNGRSIAAREFTLPRNFAMSFDLAWESNTPSYSISFADPLVKGSQKEDLYRFDFDSSGIRISRHMKGQTRYRTLAQWQRRPTQFPNKKFKVEIRVERDKRQLELLIDGESEGIIKDPIENTPSAGGVTFSCRTTSSSNQTVSNLTISELNDTRTRHLAEERGDASMDCMITTDDDRWSGKLLSLTGDETQRLLVFKTNFSDKAWEIPENEVSTLFFANNPFKEGPGGKPTMLIEFHGNGKLSTSQCLITGDQVQAIHPLLGTLEIQRSAIKAIRRIGN